MSDYTVYITHAKRSVERLETDQFLECISHISEAYLNDPSVMGYICANDNTPWSVVYWDKGRKVMGFNPKNLPSSIKALRLIGL